jgi:hypothetical protein
MPDITICTNADCPLSWECWRFNAPPSEQQWVERFECRETADGGAECEYYQPMTQ